MRLCVYGIWCYAVTISKLYPILVSGSYLEPMTRFLFSVWLLRVSWCGEPSVARGWDYNLPVQFLLGLATAITPGSKSHRTNDHILLSHLRLPQLGGQSPCIYILHEQGGPVIPPGTGLTLNWFEVEVEVKLRPTDSQSASLSWCQAPIWDPRPIFLPPRNCLQIVAGLIFCSALSH
jgi:hypothetical protein